MENGPGTSTGERAVWRRRLQLAAAFGVGFGASCLLLVGAAIWWINQPRPWDDRTLTASFVELDSQPNVQGSPEILQFRYAIRNTGRSDYLSHSTGISIMFKRGEVLREARRATLAVPGLIPAGQSGEIELIVMYDELADLVSSRHLFRVRPEDVESVEPKEKGPRNVYQEAVRLVPSELEGFVLFDAQHRYRIDLPKGW